tara:strand:+ start:2804 stop:3316 length:513 start_codon:yes stop_codon:yes gene_type:complete
MTCNLDKAWNNAEAAMKAMFEAGFHHEGDIPEGYKIDFRDHITDIWHMYQNVVRINGSRKEQWKDAEGNEAPELKAPEPTFTVDASDGFVTLPDGCYDPDGNISIGTDNITLGDAIASVPDAISWNNQVFTTPTTLGDTTTIAPPQATQSGELPVDPEKNAEELNNRDGD